MRVYPLLDGCAIIEHWQGLLTWGKVYGFSVRAFDPAKQKWMLLLNWPQKNRAGFGLLEGEFTHGRGEFFSSSTNQAGQRTETRYSFSDITPTSLRWDGARSEDGGTTWLTNWIMEMSRRDPMALPLFNGPAPIGQRPMQCDEDVYREYDFLIGEWEGGDDASIALSAYPILDGCAVVEFVHDRATGHKEFRIRSYVAARSEWVMYAIDNRDPVFRQYVGDASGVTSAGQDSETRLSWHSESEETLVLERSDRDAVRFKRRM